LLTSILFINIYKNFFKYIFLMTCFVGDPERLAEIYFFFRWQVIVISLIRNNGEILTEIRHINPYKLGCPTFLARHAQYF